jgi:hypothetical protein
MKSSRRRNAQLPLAPRETVTSRICRYNLPSLGRNSDSLLRNNCHAAVY